MFAASLSPTRRPNDPPRNGSGPQNRGVGQEEVTRILLIEDNAGDAELTRYWLAQAEDRYELIHRTRLADGIAALAHDSDLDLVLLDLRLPDAVGLDALNTVTRSFPEVAVVVLTGRDDEALAQSCVSLGAHDYLRKHEVSPEALRRSIALATTRASLARARAKLEHAERLRALGELAAGVAHEINNPLQFVLSNLEFASDCVGTADPSDEQQGALVRALDDARRGVVRISTVARSLRRFARSDSSPMTTTNPSALLEEAARAVDHLLRAAAELQLRARPTQPVLGHPDRLLQVIVNLLTNAIHAIADEPGGWIMAEVRDLGTKIELTVEDNGPGIPPEELARIFVPFFTTRAAQDGTGLGLPISQAIALEHGGRLRVESTVGIGTRAVLELPVHHPEAMPVPEAVPDHEPETSPLRILVVDDEPMVLAAIGKILYEHEVSTALGGREGLERVLADDFDIVLCDIGMPELDGPGLYAAVEKARPDLLERFLFLTGGTQNEAQAQFAEQMDALDKPLGLDALREAIRQRS